MCELSFAPDGSSVARASQLDATVDVVRVDGTRRFGPVPWQGPPPAWSPAGTWLAIGRCDDTSGECARSVIVQADGSTQRELPGEPVWSPGDRVMAIAEPDGSLLVGNGDGTNLHPIGTFPAPAAWSPDGTTFVFIRDGDAWLAGADGSGVRNLTEFPLGGAAGAWWSPDGRWIAVLQGSTMWMFAPDGSIRQRLGTDLGPTDASWGPDWAPAWSPDGEWVAIEHGNRVTLFRLGDWNAVRLENAWQPAWSIDGRHLAVVAESGDGAYRVDVTNPDGSNRTPLSAPISYPPIAWFR
jgi:Tol biopolymer transport system component